MSTVAIPVKVWRDVRDFFERLAAPCRDCLRGNPTQCWQSNCAAFKYRIIARDVLSVNAKSELAPIIPHYIRVEQEILGILKSYDYPITPATLRLRSTHSKSVKSKTISRLVRQGRIVEERIGDYTRYISLPKKRKNNEQSKPTNGSDTTSRRPSHKLGQ